VAHDPPRPGTPERRGDADAEALLTPVCGSRRWVREVAAGRPYASVQELADASALATVALGPDDLAEALAEHPRIGERTATEGHSAREQAGLDGAGSDVLTAIADGNREYEERFGHVYLVRAKGRDGDELLALLQQRLRNDEDTEAAVVREQLAEINALRLQELFGG
jgi:2-oxo-4-hydroxy-4-carboxy-5-ureidoimidazoline decarboxylase